MLRVGASIFMAFISALLFTWITIAVIITLYPRTAHDGQTGMLGMITLPIGAGIGLLIATKLFKQE